jgi:hypothetical protein
MTRSADEVVKTSMTSLFGSMSSVVTNPLRKTDKVELVPPYKVTLSVTRDGKKYPGVSTIGIAGFTVVLDENGYGEVEVK